MRSIAQALTDGFAAMFGTPDNTLDYCDASAIADRAETDPDELAENDARIRAWDAAQDDEFGRLSKHRGARVLRA